MGPSVRPSMPRRRGGGRAPVVVRGGVASGAPGRAGGGGPGGGGFGGERGWGEWRMEGGPARVVGGGKVGFLSKTNA